MRVPTSLFALLVVCQTTSATAPSKGDLFPERYGISNDYSLDPKSQLGTTSGIELNSFQRVATLDYGTEAAGYPFFDIQHLSGEVQIEAKYGEQFDALQAPFADGPWTFQAGTGTNSFRTETLNVTRPGRLQSYFAQGGQRWQSLRLLTNGSVTLIAGLRLTSVHLAPSQLPGRFASSRDTYDRIYDLGGRAAQVACVDIGAAPAVWKITPHGALIRGQSSAQSAVGINFANYTLSFSTLIVRGGTGFRVASGVAPYGSYFVLTSNYPDGSTYVNTDRELLPAKHLIYGYEWGIINQTTLPVPEPQYYPLNISIEEEKWYRISIALTPSGYNVTLGGVPLAFVPNTAAANSTYSSFGSNSPTTGTWGFGPFQDQAAYVKDVEVRAGNGSLLYNNSMTDAKVLVEYGVAANENPVCLDGGKRDRLVWTGDFVHTLRTVLASTYRTDYLRGTIKQAYEWTADFAPIKGFTSVSSPLGGRPQNKAAQGASSFGLTDYQDLFLISIGDYYRLTGDIAFLEDLWPQIKTNMASRLAFNDDSTGLTLTTTNGAYFLGSFLYNSTGVSAANAVALQSLVPIAEALNDTTTAKLYSDYATKIGSSLNKHFWNPTLGAYSVSITNPSDFDIVSIAFTIRAGFANATQTTSMLSKLSELRLGIGYKTGTYVESSNTTNLSPFLQGFLLESIFIANQSFGTSLEPARILLDSFWPAMVTQDKYYSGASWEYTYPDGRPGLDLFTSLAHPWGSAPTYLLPEYALGISATKPGFEAWQFRPLVFGMGLDHANGTVYTPKGPIEASWLLGKTSVRVNVSAPAGTSGQIILPGNRTVAVKGGSPTQLSVPR